MAQTATCRTRQHIYMWNTEYLQYFSSQLAFGPAVPGRSCVPKKTQTLGKWQPAPCPAVQRSGEARPPTLRSIYGPTRPSHSFPPARSIIMTTGMTKQGWKLMSLRVGKPSAQNMLLYCLTPQDSMSRLQRIHMCNSAPLSLNLLQKSWKWRTISVSKQGSHWSEGPPASSPRAPPVKSKKWGHTQIWDVPTEAEVLHICKDDLFCEYYTM